MEEGGGREKEGKTNVGRERRDGGREKGGKGKRRGKK